MRFKPALTISVACLLLVACSVATIVTLIDNALTIALEAAAATGNIPPQYVGYVSAALQGIECSAAELATADTSSQKRAKIIACLAGVIANNPVFPPGTDPDLVALIQKLAAAIQNIENGLPSTKAGASQKHPVEVTVTPDQKAHLLDDAAKARVARAKFVASHPIPAIR